MTSHRLRACTWRILLCCALSASGACSSFEIEQQQDAAPDREAGHQEASADAPPDLQPAEDGPATADLLLERCPPGLAAPAISSFTITDNLRQVTLGQEVSLVLQATGAAGQQLAYAFSVTPDADPVQQNGDGTGRWQLSSAPPLFFTSTFTLSGTVRYACSGGPEARAEVTLQVLGNVLVTDRAHATIKALGSNGVYLGDLIGPALLSNPSDLLLLSTTELVVGDLGPAPVKVIDLPSGTVLRSFGGDVTDLSPRFLDRHPSGDILVGFARNQLLRYSPQGDLVETLTAPHPYGSAGLAQQQDGTMISGVSGAGTLYSFAPDGSSLGLWANPSDTSDTNSLLALPGGEILMGARTSTNHGRLIRLSAAGAVLSSESFEDYNFYYLQAFADGYLFVKGFYNKVFRLDQGLTVAAEPFATLAADDVLGGMVWLDVSSL